MDIGTIHSIWTIVLFVSFLGVVWWAYGKSRKARFDEAANLVFADEQEPSEEKEGVTK
ncbi:CcoQ/FixQ family Cbb3-type cytochrome c oxidase assembly chaperone [Vibrio sp. vnigr-6D03]|uniref:cbb3-type cytochrome oxidase subunit 3 n=1 Tax=Vibrio TaxID=662 RepID=UPI000C34D589|nr:MULTISPECIES: cbb3-type cytochrome oxidase subunit 3 [Vibrio]MDP2571679.1 cbb3-type cytochrome oxidase subunit 3 [Vibrio penaeicida]PKF78033.1 CcoQ/FixQ family Cbb3-type cytochrome c oxidase assembly chaperone [Vibrio sp. vnigr-6D03]RTZ23590.1 cbb3-type cytochrome oxidase subunit 3 [Vibrio penaeicida]